MQALLMARVRHPNIVRVLGVCVSGACRQLVMELCDGGNLRQVLDREGAAVTGVGATALPHRRQRYR